MGIRNKVTKKGFVSTNASDVNSGFFGFEQQLITAAGTYDVETSFVVVSSSAPDVTASLPALKDELVGTVVRFMQVSGDDFLLSASNPIVSDGGATVDWTRVFDNVSAFQIVDIVAVGSSTGPALLNTGEKFVWVAGELDTDV